MGQLNSFNQTMHVLHVRWLLHLDLHERHACVLGWVERRKRSLIGHCGLVGNPNCRQWQIGTLASVAYWNACVFWVDAHVKNPCLATLALWGPR